MRRVVVPVLLVALAAACGAARPAFDGQVYRSGTLAFRLPAPPASWRRVDVDDATLAFRDDEHDASVLLNARCNERDDDAPLVALTNHLMAGTTDRTTELEETIPFDQREARHTHLTAKLDGVLLAYDVYVMKKDGCVYDFVYVVEPRFADRGVPDFERFVMGFHTLPKEGA